MTARGKAKMMAKTSNVCSLAICSSDHHATFAVAAASTCDGSDATSSAELLDDLDGAVGEPSLGFFLPGFLGGLGTSGHIADAESSRLPVFSEAAPTLCWRPRSVRHTETATERVPAAHTWQEHDTGSQARPHGILPNHVKGNEVCNLGTKVLNREKKMLELRAADQRRMSAV